MSVCSPHEFLHNPRLPELSLAVWTAAGDIAAPVELGTFLVDDSPFPSPDQLSSPHHERGFG